MPKAATLVAAALSLVAMLGMLGTVGFGHGNAPLPAPKGDQDRPADPLREVAGRTQWEAMTGTAPLATISRLVPVARGDSLMSLLTHAGVPAAEAHAAIAALDGVYDPRRDLQIGQNLSLTFRPQGDAPAFAGMVLPYSYDLDVAVSRSGDGFAAQELTRAVERRVERIEGEIHDSIYQAGVEVGLPPQLLVELIRIYSYDVDFQRGVHPGDRFELMYERVYDAAGTPVHAGDVLYAKLTLSGRELPLFRYETKDGKVDYYSADGESVRKALLLTPIDGARISSGFGRRNHPILGYTRMHAGVDFAAPSGTPVFAAGDGVIETIGRNAGYGNYIRIRHNSTYKTAYGHLKGFARGMKRGQHVSQGQVIAYVGATGLATGPHLHFEVHQGDSKVNPMALKLPKGDTLEGEELRRFAASRDALTQQFAALDPVQVEPAAGATVMACAEDEPGKLARQVEAC